MSSPVLSRRGLIAASAGALTTLVLPTPSLAAPASARFRVFRKGQQIGTHTVSVSGAGGDLTAVMEAELTVKIGPITALRYKHAATEVWKGGRFSSLKSRTDSNGKIETVDARGVAIESSHGRFTAPAGAVPFSHWNRACMSAPLFNPQTGKVMRLLVTPRGEGSVATASGSIRATRYSITGEAKVEDWYDASGAWAALSGTVKDGSVLEYRRV